MWISFAPRWMRIRAKRPLLCGSSQAERREEIAILVDAPQDVIGLEAKELQDPRFAAQRRTSAGLTGVDTVGVGMARTE